MCDNKRYSIQYLSKGLDGPGTEPVYDTSVEQRRRGGTAALEALAGRIHGEDDMQSALDLQKQQIENVPPFNS